MVDELGSVMPRLGVVCGEGHAPFPWGLLRWGRGCAGLAAV